MAAGMLGVLWICFDALSDDIKRELQACCGNHLVGNGLVWTGSARHKHRAEMANAVTTFVLWSFTVPHQRRAFLLSCLS
jgi:hypothetical protein